MNNIEFKGIKIFDSKNKHVLWHIDEEMDNSFKISLMSDRSTVTTINKKKCYIVSSDGDYLYSDTVIDTSFTLPFAFANFKTMSMD